MAADSSTSAQKRRVTKPLIEKRRRARINFSLAQLKEMVAKPNSNTQENRANRLEKADILEMTVEYVKRVHGTCNATESSNNTSLNPDSDHSFEEGYRLCMSEVHNFFISNYRKQPSKEFLNRSLQSYLKQKIQRTPVTDRDFIITTSFDMPISSKRGTTPSKSHFRKYDKMVSHEKNFQINIDDNYEFHSETSNFGSNTSSVSTDDEMLERLPVVEKQLKELKDSHMNYAILQQYPIQQHGNVNISVSESMWRPW